MATGVHCMTVDKLLLCMGDNSIMIMSMRLLCYHCWKNIEDTEHIAGKVDYPIWIISIIHLLAIFVKSKQAELLTR